MNDETDKISHSALNFLAKERVLLAILEAAENSGQVTVETVQKKIDDEKFAHLFFADGVLSDLVNKVNSGETGEFEIGQVLDATADLQIADDNLSVTITASPAYEGQSISRAQLGERLMQAGIDPACLIESALTLAEVSHVDELLIAKALPPQHGEDTKFEMLVNLDLSFAPKVDEDGNVELHELQDFVHIEAGTPLMRRVPATKGVPGTDVLGKPIVAVPGEQKPYARNTEGVKIDPKDENVLIATIAGHPVAIAEGVRVDQVLLLKGVDLKTGNVDFDGSVDVRGDVGSGFMIEAEGDVRVQGTVERAHVRCGGDLLVTGGILGGRGLDDVVSTNKKINQFEVGGLLRARYVSHSELRVKGNIEVREYLQAVEVNAGGDVLLGQEGGAGQIIAGDCHFDKSIRCNILGNEANVNTILGAGGEGSIANRLSKLKQVLVQRETEVSKLAQILEKIRQASNGDIEQALLSKEKKIENTIVAGRAEAVTLTEQIAELQRQLDKIDRAYIEVKKQVHANVSVTIDGIVRRFKDEMGPQYLIRLEDEIINRG